MIELVANVKEFPGDNAFCNVFKKDERYFVRLNNNCFKFTEDDFKELQRRVNTVLLGDE